MTEAPFPIPPSVEDKLRVFPVPGWREVLYCTLLALLSVGVMYLACTGRMYFN